MVAAGAVWDPSITQTFPPYEPTAANMLRYGAEHFADDDAVVTPDERLSYRDLDAQSVRLAAHLVELGVGKGTHVGILAPNGVAWVLTWAAAARIGAVAVPVNTFYRTGELATMLRHADVQLLVSVDRFIQHDYVARLQDAIPELALHGPGPLYLPSMPALRRIVFWGPSPVAWADGELSTYATAGAEPAPNLKAVVEALEADVVPADRMLITYTSGSTGEPKGVVHGQGALVRHARNLAFLADLTGEDRIWTPMPLCWVGGFAFTLLRALSVGAAFVTQDTFEIGETIRVLERERITCVSAWPQVAKAITEHPDFPGADLTRVRAGSFYDAMPEDKRPRDPGLTVGSLGMSETCGPHTFWFPKEDQTGAPEEHRGCFGHEVPGVDHRIVDPETGKDMPEGEEGEVLVRGYSLMLGLYKKERGEVFDEDGWYHTGDRGLFRQGWFYFTGRQTDLIKTKGSNVAPAEVEKTLLELDVVKAAFVVGVDHPDRGQDVVALVVPWRADADPEAIRSEVKERISSYKVPRHVFLIGDADVPYLTSQKPDKRALLALGAAKVAALAGDA